MSQLKVLVSTLTTSQPPLQPQPQLQKTATDKKIHKVRRTVQAYTIEKNSWFNLIAPSTGWEQEICKGCFVAAPKSQLILLRIVKAYFCQVNSLNSIIMKLKTTITKIKYLLKSLE